MRIERINKIIITNNRKQLRAKYERIKGKLRQVGLLRQ